MPRKNKLIIRTGSGAPSASDFATSEPAWDGVGKTLYVKANDGTMAAIAGGGGGGGTAELVYSYATTASFPGTGDSSLLYFATDTGRIYRWNGSVYVELGPVGGGFSWATVPATSIAAGTAGDIAYDANYLYVCTAASTWRAARLLNLDGDPYWANVSLLLKFDGSGATITDSSSEARSISVFGNSTQSTTQSKWGGKSLYLDGTGDYLTSADNAAFGFSTGDFTIEYWHYPTQNVGDEAILDMRANGSVAQWLWFGKSSGGAVRTYDANSVRTGGSMNLNAWNHVAWSRVSGVNQVYLNGTRVISWTNAGDVGATRSLVIGANADGNAELSTAYIDDLRITKGVGRYNGATLTQPTAAFPTFGQ